MGLFDRPAISGSFADGTGAQVHEALNSGQSAEQLLEQGMELEQQGQMEEALQCYESAITLMPALARAHFNRGSILLDRGDAQDALEAFTKAVRYKPDSAGAHFNMGAAYVRLDRHAAAIAAYRQAITLKPDFPQAEMALGAALEELGQHEAAIASYRRVLAIHPDYPETHHKLVSLLIHLDRLDEVAACYIQMLELDPENVDVLNKLGATHKEQGRLKEAEFCFRQALKIQPDGYLLHNNLGATLRGRGLLNDAALSYRRALDLQPNFAEGHHNLANVLSALRQTDLALSSYRRALEIKPDFSETLTCMGVLFQELGQFNDAIASHQRALSINPGNAHAHSNLGHVLQELGQFESALLSTRRSLEIDPDFCGAYDSLLFMHNYLADQPALYLRSEAERYGAMVARHARPDLTWKNSPNPTRTRRVGLVSGDLCVHPVGYFLEGILTALKTSALPLELFAYPTRFCDDELSRRIKANCQAWHPVVGLSDEDVAGQIRADEIDILVDLSGHTAHNRLPVFAWKPAPVQVSWLGYFATTGVAAIDYLIADPWTLPISEESSFTEKVWRMPQTRLCFTPPDVAVAVSLLPALSNPYVTFGCFNNLSKMNNVVVALWARILNAVPASRLFLKARQLKDASTQHDIVGRFAAHGIDPERLILEEYVPRENYLAAYQRVDIALDPFPYPGGTTTVEALWMGIPVLTLAGDRFLSRQGVGLLMNAGLPDWIATDPDDYFARAVSHASDVQSLARLRAGLRAQVLASPIFDAPRFAANFEAALRGMWQIWCAQH
jgi:protein O-GlcNAc transferase